MDAVNEMKIGTWEFVVRRADNGHAVMVGGRMCHRGRGASRAEAGRDCIARVARLKGIPEEGLVISGAGTAEDLAAAEIEAEEGSSR